MRIVLTLSFHLKSFEILLSCCHFFSMIFVKVQAEVRTVLTHSFLLGGHWGHVLPPRSQLSYWKVTGNSAKIGKKFWGRGHSPSPNPFPLSAPTSPTTSRSWLRHCSLFTFFVMVENAGFDLMNPDVLLSSAGDRGCAGGPESRPGPHRQLLLPSQRESYTERGVAQGRPAHRSSPPPLSDGRRRRRRRRGATHWSRTSSQRRGHVRVPCWQRCRNTGGRLGTARCLPWRAVRLEGHSLWH